MDEDFMVDMGRMSKSLYRQIAIKQANGSPVFFSLVDVNDPLEKGFGVAITLRVVPCLDEKGRQACIFGSAMPVYIKTSVANDEPMLVRQVKVENSTHFAYRPTKDLRESILLLRSISKRYTQLYLVGLPCGKI